MAGVYRRKWQRRTQLRRAWVGTNSSAVTTLAPPTATATVAGVAPGLAVSYTVPTATATVAGVAPNLAASYTVPAATCDAAGVAPSFAVAFTVPTATASVACVAPSLAVAFGVPAATVTAEGVPPSLETDVTFVVPTAVVTAEMVPPTLDTGGADQGFFAAGAIAYAYTYDDEGRQHVTFYPFTMRADVQMIPPQLLVRPNPVDDDLALLLELQLV